MAPLVPPSKYGVQTLQTQDSSDPIHFGTVTLVPQCQDILAPVPKCLGDSSPLVPNCLDFHQTFFYYATIARHVMQSVLMGVLFLGLLLQIGTFKAIRHTE